MRELSQIRDAVVSALAAEGMAALDAYPDQRARRYGCPVAAVAVETAESRTVGFCNYLGEVFDTGAGAPRELYGKQLEAVISIEIRGQRAADCEQGCETAAQFGQPGILRGVLCQQFPVRSYGVECRSPELLRREDQVLVLRVDVQQARAQVAQLCQLHGYVVDECTALARRGDHARQRRLGGVVEVVFVEKRFEVASREVEDSFHRAVPGRILHCRTVVFGSEQQAQGSEQDGFPGSRFTCYNGKACFKTDIQFFYQCVILNIK